MDRLTILTAEEGRGRADWPPWRLLRPEKEDLEVDRRDRLVGGELMMYQVGLIYDRMFERQTLSKRTRHHELFTLTLDFALATVGE